MGADRLAAKPDNTEPLVLAGDVGGTKTDIGLFARGRQRPRLKAAAQFASQDAPDLETIVSHFLEEHPARIAAACFGVAGPVINGRCKTTNLPWIISEQRMAEQFKWPRVRLVNDLIATGLAVPLMPAAQLVSLNPARPQKKQNIAIIAPGTGLGQAFLVYHENRYIPVPSEGGHADFCPQSDLQVQLWRYLHRRYGHVSLEKVLSGPGLVNIYTFLKKSGRYREPRWLVQTLGASDPARSITTLALNGRHPLCTTALDLFVAILGAAAGNLALTGMAVGGVYLGGGIVPQILTRLKQTDFVTAFTNKGRFQGYLEKIAVRVIVNKKAALLGAAGCALQQISVQWGRQ